MNKKTLLLLFSLIAVAFTLIITCSIGLMLNNSSDDSSDVNSNEYSVLTNSTVDDTSVYNNSDVVVNTDISIDEDISQTEILHGWVINNMGYTYFYNDSAYQQFNFKSTALDRYVNSLNNLSNSLSDNTKLYNIIVPVSSSFANIPRDIYTNDNFYNASQSTFVSTVSSKLSQDINNVSIISQLEAQYDNNEYVFFRSDKNWTALGAYTAYKEFCSSAGIDAHDISKFETFVVEEHLGSYYNSLSADKDNEEGIRYSNILLQSPDKIIGYKPLENVKTVLTVYDSGLVYDNYLLCKNSVSSSNAYNVFLGKYAERYEINTNVGEKNLLIIGDESAYPLVSFLASHYRKIDVINPFKYKGKLDEFLANRYYDDCINICYSTNAVVGEYVPKLNIIIGESNE